MARLKSCIYCGRVHPVDFICDKKLSKMKEKNNRTTTKYDRFRKTSAWVGMREYIKIRDYSICKVCACEGKISSTVQVHHIVPMREDETLWLDSNNLICLCKYHHEQAEKNSIKREYLRELIR